MLRGLVEDSGLFILGQSRLVSVVILGYSILVWDGGSGYNRTEWTGYYGTVMLIGLIIVEQEC